MSAWRGVVDLNQLLIAAPRGILFLRVAGDSMHGAGIQHGDLLVVDRHRTPRAGQIVVALLEGNFTLKRLRHGQGQWWLEAAHPAYTPIPLGPGSASEPPGPRLWGVAIHRIRSL